MMKSWLLCLTVSLLTVVCVYSSSSKSDVSDYQAEILKLYQNIGHEDTYDFIRKDFPFADTKYFTEPKVVGKFIAAYKDGFLNKDGYFNLYSYKNRHDTYRLLDIFYFAKDFETFIKIAKWAKTELHPLQFVYAFTAAIYHRKDTEGVVPPPFYEVVPHYFTPADVMTSAYKAMIQDVKYRKFDVNGTGYEYSWYKDQSVDAFKFGPKYNEFDVESRMAYFREDVGVNDWYSKCFMQVAPWINDEKYPDLTWNRRGEYMYAIMKYILGKYNLERYGSKLPPVQPMDFKKTLRVGYNPKMVNIQGRPFLSRPDGINPFYTNTEGVEALNTMYQRIFRDAQFNTMFNPFNTSSFNISGVEGFDVFSKIFFGITQPAMMKFYRPIYYQAIEALENSVRSSNDVGNSGTVVGNYLTELRDPAFYKVLAYLDGLFRAYNSRKRPYTSQQLTFPGVEIKSLDFTKLETYFDRFEYDISNGIPYKGDTGKYKYLANKYRMNHKPFTYKLKIQSDKDVEGIIKIYIAPKYDSNFRSYGISAFVKYGILLDVIPVTLKSGSNVVERKSSDSQLYKNPQRLKHIVEKLQRSQQNKEPFFYPSHYYEAFPSNLMLPRGSKEGTYYQFAAVIQPQKSGRNKKVGSALEIVQVYDPTKFYLYPFDRPMSESAFDTPSVYFTDYPVYDITHY